MLDSREGLLKGGDDGKVIVPGHPAESDLIRRVTSKDPDEKMPPKDGALTAQQVADLTAWVRMGAPDPRTNSVIAAQPAVNAKAALGVAADSPAGGAAGQKRGLVQDAGGQFHRGKAGAI